MNKYPIDSAHGMFSILVAILVEIFASIDSFSKIQYDTPESEGMLLSYFNFLTKFSYKPRVVVTY